MDKLLIYTGFLVVFFFIITLHLMPKIRGVVKRKELCDHPNKRSSHSKLTPSLGGIAFFISLMISICFIAPFDTNKELTAFVPGLSILLITGLKDDLLGLVCWKKLLMQILAATFVVFSADFNSFFLHPLFNVGNLEGFMGINSLHGFMGIGNIAEWVSALLSIFIIITVINALNLIDGIDGLASSISIVIFTGFSFFFYCIGNYHFMLIAVVLTGSLFAFLIFNLSKTSKIFMGDTGSLILGFMAGSMAVKAIAIAGTSSDVLPFPDENILFIVLGLLFVPLFDTGRVFLVRILKGKSPFKADKNHTHHIIIDFFNISHRRASFFLAQVNFIIFILLIILATQINQWLMLLVFVSTVLLGLLILHLIKKQIVKRERGEEERGEKGGTVPYGT